MGYNIRMTQWSVIPYSVEWLAVRTEFKSRKRHWHFPFNHHAENSHAPT